MRYDTTRYSAFQVADVDQCAFIPLHFNVRESSSSPPLPRDCARGHNCDAINWTREPDANWPADRLEILCTSQICENRSMIEGLLVKGTTVVRTTAIVITASPSFVRCRCAIPSRSQPHGPGSLVLLVRSVLIFLTFVLYQTSSEPYNSTTLSISIFRCEYLLF